MKTDVYVFLRIFAKQEGKKPVDGRQLSVIALPNADIICECANNLISFKHLN